MVFFTAESLERCSPWPDNSVTYRKLFSEALWSDTADAKMDVASRFINWSQLISGLNLYSFLWSAGGDFTCWNIQPMVGTIFSGRIPSPTPPLPSFLFHSFLSLLEITVDDWTGRQEKRRGRVKSLPLYSLLVSCSTNWAMVADRKGTVCFMMDMQASETR